MAKTPADPNRPKAPRRKAEPKPVFIVVDGDAPILGVFRRAEEVLKVLEESPNAKYHKVMLTTANTAQ